MDYRQFIEDKIISTPESGFNVFPNQIHESLYGHQKDTVMWCAKGGRRAVFKSFGLGKTRDQLELMRLCLKMNASYEKKLRGLIVCPLGVRHEFRREAEALDMKIQYVRNNEDIEASETLFMITNYERVRDGQIDLSQFIFASLDEASVLRSYGSKTYQEFLPLFACIPFRYVFTATPSPNKYKELIHYAGFLGVMDTGQALTRFFKRDSTQANNLTLHPHKEKEFWLWVSTWALFLTKPSDLGYDDTGYDLPEIKVFYHRISLNVDEILTDDRGQHKMYRDMAIDLRSASKEKRSSLQARVDKTCELIASDDPEKHWLVWHHLEDERRAIEKAVAECKTVYGSQDLEEREELLIGFSEGAYRILATKPDIAGSGCNFQRHCHAAIFMGIDYKFNDFIQAIHRIQRFQQPCPVEIHVLYTDSEENILKELQAKWTRHDELVKNMTDLIKEFGLSHSKTEGLKREIGVTRRELKGVNYTWVNNDNVQELQRLQSNRFGMILTSIPFSNHYEYTPSYLDFGHTNNDDHFFQQMDFLTPELHRVLMPGRVAAIHVKDRILFGSVTGDGMPTVNPFHAKTIFHYLKHGFRYCGMITIETDVVRENKQTYRLGWSEQCKDGSKMGVGSPEYLLIFRKLPTDTSRAYADQPVTKSKADYSRGQWQIDARAKWNSSGNRLLTLSELVSFDLDRINRWFTDVMQDSIYDYDFHVRIAEALEAAGKLPSTFETLKVPSRTEEIWHDIVRKRTLNSNQTRAHEENHICPFQLDVVDRAINRWSNPGDEIFDCFAGLGSVGVEAIPMDRKFYGVELNPESFRCGGGYLRDTEYKLSVPKLFDDLKVGAPQILTA
jgi:hypothetical protein